MDNKRGCPLGCVRFQNTGDCIHLTTQFQQLVAEQRVGRRLEKEQLQLRQRRLDEERIEKATFGELEVPKWEKITWATWRAETKHVAGVYLFLDVRDRVLVAGDATDMWKRFYSWQFDDIVQDVVTIWCLKTLYTKEVVIALRHAMKWDLKQLRDVIRRTPWSPALLEAALKKHPLWELAKLEDKIPEQPTQLEFWL